MDIINSINEIENNIIKYDITTLNKNISSLTNQIAEFFMKCNENHLRKLNSILEYMQIGLNNNDYLLVADILHFELKPLIQEVNDGIN